MKLLFDQNLSPHLIGRLRQIFPDSSHVYLLQLDKSSDELVWEYARERGYTLVTKDVDFTELSMLRGFPPKIVWIRRGNCSTSDIEAILRIAEQSIKSLDSDPNIGIIELF